MQRLYQDGFARLRAAFFELSPSLSSRCQSALIPIFTSSPPAQRAPRTHGYARKGQRCCDVHDWHARGRVNAIGAILDFEFLTVELWENTIDSDVFYTWLTQALLPKCSPNAVSKLANHPNGNKLAELA